MTTEQAAKTRGGQHAYVLATIPVEMIEIQEQIRQDWEHDDSAEKMRELTETVREWGILQPLLVKQTGAANRYRLVAGHRRYKGALEAGDPLVPCMIWSGNDKDIPLIQLIENTQRQHLSFADKVAALQKLVDGDRSSASVDHEWSVPHGTTARILRIACHPVLMSGLTHDLIAESTSVLVLNLHEDYSAPLYDMLRNHQRVTEAMVQEARQQQERDGIVKDAHVHRRGLTDHTKVRVDEVGKLTEQGLTLEEIATHLGISKSLAYQDKQRYQYGLVSETPLTQQALRSLVIVLSADGLSRSAIAIRAGVDRAVIDRILREIERDASAPASNYFAQPDSDAPIPNAVRSPLPQRTDNPTAPDAAPSPVHTRPTHSPILWENMDEDMRLQTRDNTGLPVTVDTRDYLVNAVQTKDAEQTGATTAPTIPPRYVADPTLADMTVLLRNHLTPLLRLLQWAGGHGMNAAQLHDEIKDLYGTESRRPVA